MQVVLLAILQVNKVTSPMTKIIDRYTQKLYQNRSHMHHIDMTLKKVVKSNDA